MAEAITAEWLQQKLSGEWGLQSALADFMGLDKTKMNKIVKGTRLISSDEADMIKRFFEVRREIPKEPDEDIFRAAIASRLKEAREAAGYSSASVAAAFLGVVSTTYRHHENGTRGIKPWEAVKYAEAYHISLDWLYTGNGTMLMSATQGKLPQDAQRSLHAVLRAFSPDLKMLLVDEREYRLLLEASDIFCRLYGTDAQKSKDAEILSSLFPERG